MSPDAPDKVHVPGTESSGTTTGILTVVLLYAVFASLWILLSDKAVEWLLTDPARMILASTIKGWAFVFVTSLLLYGMMRRLLRTSAVGPPPSVGLRPLLMPLVLIVVVIAALTGAGITHTVIHQKDMELARLHTIADLKTRQIADWLTERYGDGRFVQTSHLWVDLFRRWRDEGDEASRVQLQGRFNALRKTRSFRDVVLLDEQGVPMWSLEEGDSVGIEPALSAAVRRAAAANQVQHFGPYRDSAGRLLLDFITPLTADDGRSAPIVVLRVDPAQYLFPTLQTWPVPSVSGETLLFRIDGDQVLYLNELRHQGDTAVKLRMPLATGKLLASRFLRGEAEEGTAVEGVDYRGVPAIGVVRAIKGTDWFLMAKLDKEEINAETTGDALWIALAGILGLFGCVTSAFLFRQRQELTVSLREREAQAEKLRALQLLDAIAEGSVDAIFAKDIDGRYLLFNRAAARAIGKVAQEVLGRDDKAILSPEQASLIMADDKQVMEEDRCITFQEDLTTTGGEVTFLATKGPLHDDAGNVVGMFGISRDITERRRVEEALRDSLEEKEALLKEVHHRVKNNLQIVVSLLSLQSSRTPSREVVDVLRDTRNRVRSMALLHEMLYRSGNLARIDFSAYVKELCVQLQRSYGPASARVKVESQVSLLRLTLEQAMPCGLIISELVSNSLKHGFPEDRPGRVMVELHPADGQGLVLRVSDDGIGLPPGFDLTGTTSLGLKLVSNLAGQLDGQLAVERPSDGGAAFRIVFQVPQDTPL